MNHNKFIDVTKTFNRNKIICVYIYIYIYSISKKLHDCSSYGDQRLVHPFSLIVSHPFFTNCQRRQRLCTYFEGFVYVSDGFQYLFGYQNEFFRVCSIQKSKRRRGYMKTAWKMKDSSIFSTLYDLKAVFWVQKGAWRLLDIFRAGLAFLTLL